MGKGLTPKQKRITKELDDLYSLLEIDYWNIEEYKYPKKNRTVILEIQKEQAIRGYIIMQYTFIDEMLSCEICRYFFGSRKRPMQLRRTKHYQNFNDHILGNLYLLQKLTLVKAFSKIPKNIVSAIQELNVIRNGIAHSFVPEDLRRYKPVYKDKNVFTLEGMKVFVEDMEHMNDFFTKRLKGTGYWE